MGSAAVALQAAVGLVALMQMLLSATGMRVSDVLSLFFAPPGMSTNYDSCAPFHLSQQQRTLASLGAQSDLVAARLRECGVVALVGAFNSSTIRTLRDAVDDELRPLLDSRSRVLARLRAAGTRNESLASLWASDGEALTREAVLAVDPRYQERHAGRIDFALPYAPPFNRTELTASPLLLPTLRSALGSEFELQRLQVLYALGGTGVQGWHRDQVELFDSSSAAGLPPLPAHAVNVFVTLVDLDVGSGPTEFVLRSHNWRSAPGGRAPQTGDDGVRSFLVPAGSVIVGDYRIFHRGLRNGRSAPRPMLMLVYARRWWSDYRNYEPAARRDPAVVTDEIPCGDPAHEGQITGLAAGVLRRQLRAALADRESPSERARAALEGLVARAWSDLGSVPDHGLLEEEEEEEPAAAQAVKSAKAEL